METRWARVLRGWAAGGFATLVAAVSHLLAGGSFANGLGLVLALTFAGILGMVLAGRTLSRLRLSVSVVLSQCAFHFVFSGLDAGGGAITSIEHHGQGYSFGGAADLGAAQVSAAHSGAAHFAMSMDLGGWMWLAHACAAILTIAALRYGEAAFWGLRDSARMLVAAFWHGVPVVPEIAAVRDRGPVADESVAPRVLREFLQAVRYRGPPVGIRFS